MVREGIPQPSRINGTTSGRFRLVELKKGSGAYQGRVDFYQLFAGRNGL